MTVKSNPTKYPQGRSKVFSVRLSLPWADRLEKYCSANGCTPTEFIRKLINQHTPQV